MQVNTDYEKLFKDVRGEDISSTPIRYENYEENKKSRTRTVTETDLIPMQITDYRADDGSGVLFVKQENHEFFKSIEHKIKNKKLDAFRAYHDKKMMKEHDWTEDDLEEYRKFWREAEKKRNQKRGKRQKIRHFSPRSRKNMLDQMQTLDYERLTVKGHCKAKFITLTYPRMFPDFKTAKIHLDRFLKRMKRRFPKSCAIWRLEPQGRGAPHFHLMFFKLSNLPKEELSQMWRECIGFEYQDYSPNAMKESKNGRAPFTRIETIRDVRGIMWYVSKYISKTNEKSNHKLTESTGCRTAGFNGATKLTADSIKRNFHIIEDIMNRAYSCGADLFIDPSSNLSEEQQLAEFIPRCVDEYGFPEEKEILMPSCGRLWGKFNASEVEKVRKTKEAYYMDFETLQCLKRFAKNMRTTAEKTLRVNHDARGFSFYVNNDIEREYFNKLLNSGLCEVPLEEGAPF